MAVTIGYSPLQGWRVVIPAIAGCGGLAAAWAIGSLAGLHLAAAGSPALTTEALRAE